MALFHLPATVVRIVNQITNMEVPRLLIHSLFQPPPLICNSPTSFQATLIIAKLDRLARNNHFVSGLLESGIDFVCADMPQANKVMLQMYSVMAEWERDQISARTKAALQAAKVRGVVLGTAGITNLKPNIEARQEAANEFANKLKSIIEGMRGYGASQRAMCAELNSLGIKTAKGGDWSLIQLQRVIARF